LVSVAERSEAVGRAAPREEDRPIAIRGLSM
jgi:hypothetical protein